MLSLDEGTCRTGPIILIPKYDITSALYSCSNCKTTVREIDKVDEVGGGEEALS